MRKITICAAAVMTLALVGASLAQEVVATPAPVGGATVTQSQPAANAVAAPRADQWRYRWYDGRWWYWTPQRRWMWYSDDGQWVEFGANPSPPAASDDYGYYYPGVAVGVRPYGNVNVGVGRRVGVNVWGPHGDVRVGRIYVGW